MMPARASATLLLIHVVGSLSLSHGDDPSAHIQHPRPIVPRQDGHLAGHKEQLGGQRPPLGPVFEYVETPTARELWVGSVRPYRPALIRGALDGSPSLTHWNDQYLIDEFGEQEVLVEKKFEDRKISPKRMMLKDFLQQYRDQNWYVVSMLPNAMRRDCKVPKPLMCGTFRENLAELNLWIGTKGTRSMLHCDADNILHCVVSGRKDWILIHPKYKPRLDMVTNRRGQGSGFSHINVDEVDENIHAEVWDVPWEYVTLREGDCLYIPPQYLHQVRSYNRSISTTFLFYPQNMFNDDDCSGADLGGYLSLSDVYVYWTYEKNQETVDMGYMNPVSMQTEMLAVINLTGVAFVDIRLFTYFTLSMHADPAPETRKLIKWFFKALDKNENDLLSAEELKTADMEIWKQWCRDLDAPHGPTRSDMALSDKASSESPDFLPRQDDRHSDSRNAYYFLHFLIRVKGEGDRIAYPGFKKWLKLEKGSASDAFLLFDADFDGILTVVELRKSYRKRFREFSRMRYTLKGTTIGGGGLYVDEIMDLSHLEDLHDVPADQYSETGELEMEKKEKISMNETLNSFFLSLKQFIGAQQTARVDSEQFQQFLESSKLRENLGIINLDHQVFFQIIDRAQKGFILSDDAEYYHRDRPCKMWEISLHGIKQEEIFFHPSEILFNFFTLMDSAYDFINYDEKEEPQENLEHKENGKRRDMSHVDSDDSGDSEDEEPAGFPKKSEL